MGTIAARDCLRVLQLTEQVVAACLLASVQAVELRLAQQETGIESLPASLHDTLQAIRQQTEFLGEDRALENELRQLITALQHRKWSFYAS